MRTDLRCSGCGKKLAEALGGYHLVIKCPRCKFTNQLKATSLPCRAPVSAPAKEALYGTTNH
ncbi:MAG TPA: Com family DNA-binding transcriptional regulator [Candidatus Pseudomonas excrementavium]|nr:Com family DNA-binding transcriptional regulator [Candidatus Pseudomonas excrementavium]